MNYYNENDPKAAAWLWELIRNGLIAPGIVDDRSILDVTPNDLLGFTQCHFFAGIGVWSYALRLAGWPDDRPVWTGSCPCQPFSTAGKGSGFADERHLWPAWLHLIQQRRPATVLGEQVASADGLGWLDLVHSDMEATGYAFGAADLCAAGVGAPHIRQRLYWVGHSIGTGLEGHGGDVHAGNQPGRVGAQQIGSVGPAGPTDLLVDAESIGRRQIGANPAGGVVGSGTERGSAGSAMRSDAGVVADTDTDRQQPGAGRSGSGECVETRHNIGRGVTAGFWSDADWLPCRDGKWRPVEPGTFPLANGAAARVGRLRGYGNAIVAQVAATFIKGVMEL